MGNFCNLIGLEQWYFSFILKYLHVKITNLSQVVVYTNIIRHKYHS